SLNNSGKSVIASRNLTANVAQTLNNQGGTLSAGQASTVKAGTLDNQNNGRVLSSNTLSVSADTLLNTQGTVSSNGNLTANIEQLNNNSGQLSSLGNVTVHVTSLDNVAGLVAVGQVLDINASGQVNNQNGRLSASKGVQLTAASLDNTAGRLLTDGALTASISAQLLNQAGLLSSAGLLSVNAGNLDNRQGSLYAQQGLDVRLSGQLLNAQGSLKSDATGSVKAAGMNNDVGQISSVGALNVDSTANLSNLGGSVISSDRLVLNAGQVNNANGRIASAKALNATVTGLDQRNGQLFSNTSVSLDLSHGQLNNQGGLINAPGSLLLKNLGAVNNRDGEISSDAAFSLIATSLDNSAGSIISQQSLNLVVAQVLNNAKGLVSAKGLELHAASLDNSAGNLSSDADLSMSVDGTLINLSGQMSSAGLTRLNAMALDNGNGQILGDKALSITLGGALDNRKGVLGSAEAVDITAASLNNSNGGQLISDGTLTARIRGLLDNQNLGEVAAKGAVDLQAAALDNRGARIRADKALQLTVDQLDNRNSGVITGKISLNVEGSHLDNSGGLLTSVGPLTLKVGEVQNGLGRISSQSDLTAVIGALQQQGGELIAQGNLSLTGNTLDNRNGGLVGTTKALDLHVGQIDNRAGEISGALGLKVGGQRLDNSDGGKLIAGTDLELKVAQLINQNSGLIHAQGSMMLRGDTLDNTGGALNSLNGLVITLDNALLNGEGLINSEGELTVNAGTIDNTAGGLSSAAALSIVSNGGLINQDGSISTDAALTLKSTQLDNSLNGLVSGKTAAQVTTGAFDNSQGGRLTSGGTLTVTAAKVNNAAGRIASSQALTASVTGLDQQQGELFSNTNLSLDMNQGQLNNQGGLINASGTLLLSNLKDVNNQNGEISSRQAFTLAARYLDNGGGKLLSNQGLVLKTAQPLNNARGVISAASLDSRSASLDNSDGLISSLGQLDLTVDSTVDNQRGSVVADGALLLAADRLDNRAGSIAGKAGLQATVGTMDNRQGTLVSADALKLEAASLDNRQAGLVGATKALEIDVDHLDNRGGELSGNGDVTLLSQNLDNSDRGQVLAGQALKLTVDTLLNRSKGLLSAKTELRLDGGSLDNSGGYLVSQQNQRMTLSRDLVNNQGQLSSEGALSVNVANLTNTGGSLSSAGDLTVNSQGRLDNLGGELVTDNALLLTSTALDNRQQGNISGKGAVSVTTGAFNNSQDGRLNSGSTLNLKAAQVTNQDGGRIGSQDALTASVAGLDQQGGKLFSNTSLSLDMNNGQLNNQNGLINAPGTLLLKNLSGVDNRGGEISSGQAFTLAAQNLDNDNGRVLSSQGLTLRIAQALNNVRGMIGAATLDAQAQSLNNNGGTFTSRGNLDLTIDNQLDNQAQGLISAAQLLTLNSGDLNNQGGSLLAGGALVLNAMALNNSVNGLINAQGDLTLTADSLDSSAGGEVSAKGDVNLTLSALTQEGGRLLGEKAVTLNLGGSDLNNRNGLITTKGPLTLNGLRNLNNQGGEISSSESFGLRGQTLDNSGGKLISSQNLSLDGTALVNQNGLISGWQGLLVNGASLDNRNNGTLSSRNGNLNLSLLGNLLNSNGGALVSQGSLGVLAVSVDNSQQGILSSAGAQNLNLSGALDNGQGGLIDSGAGLTIKTTTMNNAGGSVNAQQTLTLNTSDLNNSLGGLIGNAAVNLNLNGVLDNSGAKLASGGPLSVQGATTINNQGGQIASQGLLTLLTAGLDNRNRGTVAANDQLTLTATGTVQNDADGLIYSQNGGVQIDAASLTNGKGTVQSQGAITLTVTNDIDNQSGRLQAKAGDLMVVARNLDNRGGVLASLQGLLTTQLSGVLKNGYDLNNNRLGGITQAQRLNLIALGGLDNYGGRISAQTGDAIVSARNFDNRNGGLYAKGKVSVTANDFDNSGDNHGQIAGSQIDLNLTGALNNRLGIIESDSTLAIRAASVDNQTGQLRALGTGGKTDFQIGGLFDNRNGKVETANSDLILNAASFQNLGGSLLHVGSGTFDISTANITNAGGSLVTRGGLTLTADNWTNSSVIQAGRLTVNVNNLTQTSTGQLLASTSLVGNGGNWTNDGLIASDGSISLALGGSYGGNGRLSSLGGIDLSAAQLNLNASSSIAGGDDSTVRVSGQLANAGRLTSDDDLTVEAGSLVNYGTLGSALNLVLKTPSLLNDRGLIFSGADMTLKAAEVTNRNGNLYGLGDVVIGGYGAAARAADVRNIAGAMESGGTFTINADVFQNRTEGDVASGGRKLLSGFIANICNDCRGDYYTFTVALREVFESIDNDTSASAFLTAGKNLIFQGGTFLNSKSTVSAAGNINITADSFQNIGSQNGKIERTRTYQVAGMSDGGTDRFFTNVLTPYNQRNNPDFPYVYYLDLDGGIHKAIPTSAHVREGGREGETYEVVSLKDSQTGQVVSARLGYNIVLPGLKYGFETSTPSRYDPNNLAEAPDLSPYKLLSDIEVATDSSGAASMAGSRNAVVQAGGSVSITATQDLQNSVIHQDYGISGGTNKIADTKATGVATTVVRLNRQLPPDLSQQQVNPLSLPGFSLPTGQNGLFRLSGQNGSAQQVAQVNSGPQNWSMGSASVDTGRAPQGLPDTQSRSVQIAGVTPVVSDSQQLTPINRQTVIGHINPSALDASPPIEGSGHSIPMPARGTGSNTATHMWPVRSDDSGLIRPIGSVPVAGNPVVATSVTGQQLSRVKGLPDNAFKTNPQKYLIETNPVLTELKQFMSSDYLLSNLGYNPDESQKRLGDGLYEQRLIQQAVVARTGQRYIDGQTSDEGLFKYLMNNAIASKDALNLSVGVSLTSEQVAALTHDIVWLEEHEVNGEKVLVPVLYLAQANNRLAPTGALIAGQDVTLIAGRDLINAGTLRATDNLSALAGQNLANSGLIEAGNRLNLLAGNNIINGAGGIISGRDVSLKATLGDVINERTVTTENDSRRQDYMDNAARIEAANDLDIGAGQDFKNIGSVMVSGRDTRIDAGRDVSIVSAQQESASNNGIRKSSVTQFGSSVDAGRDVIVNAGRDFNAIASKIGADRNVALTATENMTVSSGADETHSYYKTKKVTAQEDHVKQIGSTISAGEDVTMKAGKDLALISSRISAGDEAYLVAGDKLEVLAAQDSDYSLYDKKKKGSFGRKQTRHDEVTKVTNISSEITTGGDLTLVSGGDQRYQAAKLNSGADLTLESDGSITFEGVKDLVQETHTKSNSSMAWNSMKGKGHTDETLRQSELVAQGNLVIKAVDGLNIDIKHVNQQTVSQTIDAMVKADPKLAWLKEAEQRGDVDWRRVEEIHQSFKYSNSGLGVAAQMVLAIALAVVTGGAGAGLVGATAGTFSAGFANAVLIAVETQAANSAISNNGDLGAVLKDTFSSDSLKGYVVSGMLGGIGSSSLGYDPTKLGFDLNSAGQVILKTGADTLVQTAIQGGSLGDNFVNNLLGAVIDIGGAVAANKVGNLTLAEGSPTKIAAHALVGGLKSMAMGGDFKTGALAGGANEALVGYLAELVLPEGYDPNRPGADQAKANLSAMSQLLGVLTAVVSGSDPSIAANIAANATQYNYLSHSDLERAGSKLQGCGSDRSCIDDAYTTYHELSERQTQEALVSCAQNPDNCKPTSSVVAEAQAKTEQLRDQMDSASPEAREAYERLIAENYEFQNLLAGVTTEHSAKAVTDVLISKWGISPEYARAIIDGTVTLAIGMGAGRGRNSGGGKGSPELVEGAYSLIGANRAIIDPRKLTDYALNPDHPVGGNKARVFESVLGFTKDNSDLLMKQLREGIMSNTPTPGKVDQYGARFTVDIPVTGPAGNGVVRSGWIYKSGSNVPELTTIFVK
ncbi:DUF6883 domain-containing protein, partial [Pseudomonas sp. PSB18]